MAKQDSKKVEQPPPLTKDDEDILDTVWVRVTPAQKAKAKAFLARVGKSQSPK